MGTVSATGDKPLEAKTALEAIVVGGGIAGCAAALRAAQYQLSTAWITGDAKNRKASRAEYVYNVDNMIGLHPGIVLGKVRELLGDEVSRALDGVHLHIGTKEVVRNARERIERDWTGSTEVVDESAVRAERRGELFAVRTSSGRELVAKHVVLATGVMDRQPRVKAALSSGRVVDEIHWIYPYANHETLLYCIRCEGHLTRDTRTAVLGHAEVAAQVALMLRERYDTRVFLLTNGEELAVEPDTRRLLALEDVSVHGARITALRGAGQPKGSVLHGFELEDGLFLAADFGFVALGLHRVYNDLARELGAELEASDEDAERRHVLVEDATAETSVRGLFAVGDVAKRRDGGPLMKQIYTAQEYAVRAVDTIDRRRRAARRRARLGRS